MFIFFFFINDTVFDFIGYSVANYVHEVHERRGKMNLNTHIMVHQEKSRLETLFSGKAILDTATEKRSFSNRETFTMMVRMV